MHKLIWQNSTENSELKNICEYNTNGEQFPSSDMDLKQLMINCETKDFSVMLETRMMTTYHC